ncbi:MAG: phosphoribosylaminoimidazolecarboxamide formyltransferase / cyclohydrolase [Solirubrobacterales bacterium]|jgi:phosphoribosylaminoimidazolecarboxamide formyltransferase/IMP cyclohydrolase|nr:phosphoribosylaminoimidazolecarboxamide formyltransferase / cyclohydrolase [Solirubrobacterales bacterium]
MRIEAAITEEGGAPPGGIPVRVRRALISVSEKAGVVDFARGLSELGVQILSTGGTAAAIREAGIEVIDVAEFTGSPEILDGRVKTLHPRLHAALLARRDDSDHMATLEAEGIEPIDLVCVNLYPFQRTVERPDVTEREAVENIDIGGPTMIRAAAKNHNAVAVVVEPEAYDAVLEELRESGGEISTETRQWLANEAFAHTASYDAAISRWFGLRYESFPEHWAMVYDKFMELPYGENPHQKAALYLESGVRSHVLSGLAKQHGKPLSFNNLLDLDSARKLLDEFERPACVIVKHNNPCGTAVAETVNEAYEKAFACDPLSAFGGVIVFNRPVDGALAERLHQQFIEVLMTPGFGPGAIEVLSQKESVRILELEPGESLDYAPRERDVKRVRGGLLVQEPDRIEEDRGSMTVPTVRQPSEEQWDDLIFAWKVCRHVRSNAIVFAKGGATIGIGAGQMSRVDSVRIAIQKAGDAFGDGAADVLAQSAVASDAFYPFPDGPQAAIAAGATALIQPGGSKRDGEVIAACDEAGAAMVFTGRRHFRH